MTQPGPYSMAEMVSVLRDIDDIKRLKARYFRCVDGRDWAGLRSLFTDDCQFVSVGMRDVTSVDAFVDRVRFLIHPGVSVHHGHMPEITVTGADTAEGKWPMMDYVEVAPDAEGRRGLAGCGYYHETYRRVPGAGWRICRWELRRSRVARLREGGLELLSTAGGSVNIGESS